MAASNAEIDCRFPLRWLQNSVGIVHEVAANRFADEETGLPGALSCVRIETFADVQNDPCL